MGTYFSTLTNVKALLADSFTFRVFAGAADQTAALAKIHHLVHDVDSDEFPFAAVTYMNGGSYRLDRTSEGGGIQCFDNTREINIVLEDQQDYSAATEQAFMEVVDGIIADIATLSSPANNYILIDGLGIDDDGISYDSAAKVFQAVIHLEPRS